MKNQKNKLWAAAVLALAAPVPSFSAGQKNMANELDTTLWVGVENFRWQEFDNQGLRLLTEQGPRLSVGLALGNRLNKQHGWLYELQAQGYTGEVDYDGQDSNGIYTNSDSSYQGWRVELVTGYRKSSRDETLTGDLLLGVGATAWQRDIANSINANGQPVGGLVEDYLVYYGRAGIGVGWPHHLGENYLQIGAKRPFSIDEDVDVFGVTLSPGKKWSAYASYEFRFSHGTNTALVRFYYDSFRFGKSDRKIVGTIAVWQPESNLDTLGISLGYTF